VLDSSTVASANVDGVFVGLDWGNAHHQVCVLNSAGRVLEQGKVAHDVAGMRDLEVRLGRHGLVVGVAIERSEGLLVEGARSSAVLCLAEDVGAGARTVSVGADQVRRVRRVRAGGLAAPRASVLAFAGRPVVAAGRAACADS
jgi:hypothetical protein